MVIPNELIEARELARHALRLASKGFRQLIDDAPAKSESVNAFSKIVESLDLAEENFSIICKPTSGQVR